MFNQPLLNSSVFTFFYYFTIYSFMGWCLETVYATINKKEFVNRGFLHGPFCPIYGFGCLAIIVLLKPIQSNYFLLFLGSIFLTSTIEYITGYILETAFNSTWWDYSDKRYNLNGKICLSFSIMWGFVSIMILKVVHPYIVSMVILIPIKLGIIVFNITLLYFLVDFITTVITIFKLRSLLAQLNATYLELAGKLSDLKLNIENTKDITELKIKLEQLIESAEMKINKKKNDIENIVKELKTKYDSLLIKKSPSYSRLINAFPNLKFKGFDSILKDVKKKIHKDTKI
jgi:uncharacterized membrane protein